jgi:hypothetical protein
MALAPLLVVGGVGLADALTQNYDARESWARLGYWIQQEFGPSPSLIGPQGLATTANYYAHGECRAFADDAGDQIILQAAREFQPDVVLLWTTRVTSPRGQAMVKEIEKLGFRQVAHGELPPGTEKVFVLARRDTDLRVAQTSTRKSRRLGAGSNHGW